MGVYVRQDSPYYYLYLERAGQRGIYEATRVRRDATDPERKKENRALAENVYHARMTDLARDAAGFSPEPAKPTIRFTDYADWYEVHVTAHKRGKVREAEMLTQIRAAFDGCWLHEVTTDRVLEWKTRRLRKAAPATWNRELDVVKHMLAQAVPRYLDASPLVGLRRQRVPKQDLRILTPDEEARLLKVLQSDDQAMVIMALDTLMRLTDVVNMKRSQDKGSYLIVLDPKTDETYKVPVSKRLRKALKALPVHGEYYFSRRRIAVTPRDTIRQVLDAACRLANIPYGRGKGITFHALRHTGASRMVERGADLRTVQEIGGWKNLRQLTRYTHPTDAAKRKAVELVGKA